MKKPSNSTLPFFTYGIFRPGEIAFQIIADFVDFNRIEKRTIKGSLKLRDGLLIYDQNGQDEIHGYLLFFKKEMEDDAYQSIVEMEPGNYYTWNESQSNFRQEFNILHGKKVDKGIDEEKKNNDPKSWDYLFESIWKDPFIVCGFNMLDQYAKENIKMDSPFEGFNWDNEVTMNKYLKYQMLYLFLSSILERIMFLNGGMGMSPNKQLDLFSNDKTLIKIFEQIVLNAEYPKFKDDFNRVIHPTNNPDDKVEWDYKSSEKINSKVAIKYYYQLRSNITHRGKSGIDKFDLLKDSFEELKFILSTFWIEKEIESKKVKNEIDNLINRHE
jgi:hypothetical protein